MSLTQKVQPPNLQSASWLPTWLQMHHELIESAQRSALPGGYQVVDGKLVEDLNRHIMHCTRAVIRMAARNKGPVMPLGDLRKLQDVSNLFDAIEASPTGIVEG